MPEKAKKKTSVVKKKPTNDFIDFKSFAMNAHVHEGGDLPTPRADEADEVVCVRRKVIVKFYNICANPRKFNRANIERFLIRKGYGVEGQTLRDEDWNALVDIRTIANTTFCGGIKY